MKLSKKQETVLRLMLQGLTLKEIATKLDRKYDSVKSLAKTFLKSNGFNAFSDYLLFELQIHQKEIKALKQEVAFYKRYKYMWDALKSQAYKERWG